MAHLRSSLASVGIRFGVLFLVFLLANCGGDSSGPGGGGSDPAMLTVAAQLAVGQGWSGLNRIRIRVVAGSPAAPPRGSLGPSEVPGPLLLDTTRVYTAGTPSFTQPVPLPTASADVTVTLDLMVDNLVLFSGATGLTLEQGQASALATIPVIFSGPGLTVAHLSLAPQDTLVHPGDDFAVRATATDAGSLPIPSFLVRWSLIGAAGGASIDSAGHFTAPGTHDTLFVKGVTPNGIADSIRVTVVAAVTPTTLAISSGNNQTAALGNPLPQPLAVIVTGAGAVPVPGVVVTFAGGTGGGTVDSATATTNAQGIAQTGATLGAGLVGAQTFTASVTGLPTVTFNEIAGEALVWTGAISTDWNVAGNWNPAVVPDSNHDVSIGAGSPNAPAVLSPASARNLTIAGGASVALTGSNLTISGNATSAGTFSGTGQIVMTKTATLQGHFTEIGIQIFAPIVLSGDVDVEALLIQAGDVRINGHHLNVAFDLTEELTGTFTMIDPSDLVTVGHDAHFEGASTVGKLTAGRLICQGNGFIATGSGPAFAPSGSHTTVFTSSTFVQFDHPANSHFQNLEIDGGTLQLLSDIPIAGTLIANSAAGTSTLTATTPRTVTATSIQAARMVVDGASLAIGGGTIAQLDSITFTNSPTTVPQLSIHNPGRGTPYTFSGLIFLTTPTGAGSYVDLLDTDGAASGVLTVNLAGPIPAAPGGFIHLAGGAVLGWPLTSSLLTWTGAISVDWNNPNNWNPSRTPTSADDVVIPAGTLNGPTTTTTSTARSLAIAPNAILELNGNQLTVSGSILVQGAVHAPGLLRQDGTGVLSGTLPSYAVLLGARSTAVGTVHVAGSLFATGPGSELVVNGQAIIVDDNLTVSGLLTMTNPADSVNIGANASFTGGSLAGHLTAGALVIGGNFLSTGPSGDAFVATDEHRTVLTGGTVTVSFSTPGSGTGGFGFLLRPSGGNLILMSDVFVARSLAITDSGTTTFSGGSTRLIVVGDFASIFPAAPTIFDNVRLGLAQTSGVPYSISNLTFQNLPDGVVQFDIRSSGPGFSLSNITFSPISTTGIYLRAVDTTPADGTAMTVTVVNSSPASPGAFVQALNGAVINWP